MNNYPFYRVWLNFSLMPAWCGFILGVLMVVNCADPGLYETGAVFKILFYHIVVLVISPIIALLFSIVPAGGLGLIFAALHLKGYWLSYILVAWVSGAVMFLWMYQIFGFGEIFLPSFFAVMYPYPLINLPLKFLILGWFFTLAIALFVLPKPKNTMMDVIKNALLVIRANAKLTFGKNRKLR